MAFWITPARRALFGAGLLVASTFPLVGCTDSTGGSETESAAPALDLPTLAVTAGTAPVSDGRLTVQVLLSAPASEAVSVDYRTADGTAVAGTHYQAVDGRLSFPAGELVRELQIEVSPPEDDRYFHLILSDPVGAELAGSAAILMIPAAESEEEAPAPEEPPQAPVDEEPTEAPLPAEPKPDSAAPMVSLPPFDPNWTPVGVFSSAASCVECHRASAPGEATPVMRDAQGRDISPSSDWRHSVMANSFHDPYFQAVMEEETEVFPHLAGFIEDKCLTCHSPMARTHAHHTGQGLDPDGFYRFDQATRDMHAREGVSCTACHQIQDDGRLGLHESFSGGYTIGSDPDAKRIFGPYQNPVGNAMANRSGYDPVFGQHMQQSEHCATCHTLYTPTIDVATAQPTGREFLEQGPYLEWRNSIYASNTSAGRQCQDCHMPVPTEDYRTPIAVRPNGTVNTAWPERAPFHQHTFLGGNAYLLELLQAYSTVLGIEGSTSPEGFEAMIAKTREYLGQAAADLEVTRLSEQDGMLDIELTVTNKTGHKLPTGFPSRRMWLHLRVVDAAGNTVFESGAPTADGRLSIDQGQLADTCLAVEKPAGFTNEGCYEPHRDLITDPSQVAVYEAVLGDVNGHISHVLLHADSYVKDNRIPPKGFAEDGAQFLPETASFGVEGDADFNRENGVEGSGSDRVRYRVPAAGQGAYRVEARLLYQTVRPSFVYGMHADTPRVNRYKRMYREVPPSVEVLATTVRDS